MSARVLQLRLPLPPNLANHLKGMHWATWHRKRKAYYLRALVTERALRGQPQPFREARVEIDLYLPQRMDRDNAMARCKWAIDCLVRAGLVVDDREPYCVLAGLPGQFVVEPHGVAITLTETAPDA